jgi:hypothetical protein
VLIGTSLTMAAGILSSLTHPAPVVAADAAEASP